jgi:hypothetical protein
VSRGRSETNCVVNDFQIEADVYLPFSGSFLSDPTLRIIGKKIGFPPGCGVGISYCPAASARRPVRATPALAVIVLPPA